MQLLLQVARLTLFKLKILLSEKTGVEFLLSILAQVNESNEPKSGKLGPTN